MTCGRGVTLGLVVGCILSAGAWPVRSCAQEPLADSQIEPAQPHASPEDTDTTDIPAPLTHYQGREIAQTMHYLGADWLTRDSRQREEDCTQLLKALHLKKGQVVCDLGCGNGFYTLPLAEAVSGKGQVYAVDIQPEMLRLLADRAKQTRLRNIKPIVGTLVDPKLPADTFDLILLVDVYHEFSHPEHMLRAMRRALKPDGRMVLVEFRLEDPRVPIKLLHKMSKDQILKEIPPNGFRLVEEFDRLPWQHVMFFQRGEPENDAAGGEPVPSGPAAAE